MQTLHLKRKFTKQNRDWSQIVFPNEWWQLMWFFKTYLILFYYLVALFTITCHQIEREHQNSLDDLIHMRKKYVSFQSFSNSEFIVASITKYENKISSIQVNNKTKEILVIWCIWKLAICLSRQFLFWSTNMQLSHLS